MLNSQNHRIVGFGRYLWRSSGSNPLIEQGDLKPVVHDHVSKKCTVQFNRLFYSILYFVNILVLLKAVTKASQKFIKKIINLYYKYLLWVLHCSNYEWFPRSYSIYWEMESLHKTKV